MSYWKPNSWWDMIGGLIALSFAFLFIGLIIGAAFNKSNEPPISQEQQEKIDFQNNCRYQEGVANISTKPWRCTKI